MNRPARQICPQCGSDDVVIGDVTSFCNRCGEVFATEEATRRRIAKVVRLPVIYQPSFNDPDWYSQLEREVVARQLMEEAPPPRTRPIVISHRPQGHHQGKG